MADKQGEVLKYITLPVCASAVAGHATGQRLTATPALQQLQRAFEGFDGRKASYILAVGFNVAVVAYVGHKLYKSLTVQWETQSNLKRAASRLWRLATQGSEAAGSIPAELGQPDEHGVYTYNSSTGRVYFRQSHISCGPPSWEFSTDKALWIPVCHADSLWYNPDSCPSTADKVLIQRLEVESQLVCRQHNSAMSCGGSSCSELPELDLSQAVVDINNLAHVSAAFLCPITMEIMTQPVVTPSGASFQRSAILDWIRQHHTDPVSGAPLRSDQVFPNLAMRDMIHAWANGDSMAVPVGPSDNKILRTME